MSKTFLKPHKLKRNHKSPVQFVLCSIVNNFQLQCTKMYFNVPQTKCPFRSQIKSLFRFKFYNFAFDKKVHYFGRCEKERVELAAANALAWCLFRIFLKCCSYLNAGDTYRTDQLWSHIFWDPYYFWVKVSLWSRD